MTAQKSGKPDAQKKLGQGLGDIHSGGRYRRNANKMEVVEKATQPSTPEERAKRNQAAQTKGE